MMSRSLSWADASVLGGETFTFFPGARPDGVGLRVLRVALRSGQPAMVQFSVVFAGPAEPVYPQGTYRFRHSRLGEFDFLVTPVAQTQLGTEYEACFSHAR